jgi:hypothetical protein
MHRVHCLIKVAVGAIGSADADGLATGAVFVLQLSGATGGVVGARRLSNLSGNLGAFVALRNREAFGVSVANVGDVDGHGVDDLAVGGVLGAFYLVLLDEDDACVGAVRIDASALQGLNVSVASDAEFGRAVIGVGDLDGEAMFQTRTCRLINLALVPGVKGCFQDLLSWVFRPTRRALCSIVSMHRFNRERRGRPGGRELL